ncbi:MAG: hypothetical protein ACPGQT_05070 [Rhodothermales bacterium]
MKSLPHSDIDDLYLYAQLVAEDAEEASVLLAKALDARGKGNRSAASELIQLIAGRHMSDGGAWLTKRQVPQALEELLPRMLSRFSPPRRIAVVRAFKDNDGSASDREVFLISVRRALESDGLTSVARRLTMEGLEESMRQYLNTQMADVPETIRERWEAANRPAAPASPAVGRQFSLPARIAAGVLVILVSAAIGSWITSPSSSSSTTRSELFDTLSNLDSGSPEFRAGDAEQVERFLTDRLDWRLAVPSLDEGMIEGVSVGALDGELSFPVIHYKDQGMETELHIFVLDYRFLESARRSYVVDSSILEQIAETGSVEVRNAPDFFRVTWRFRDDIYVAVSPISDPNLRSRFRFE